ncbi:hypothetical protein [Methylocystis heyeri]|uniref:Uncharacterized protein n=1 Tax=Methylocystis heyeri TaxID=391905 RepID=A0A6B8KCF1_9HYPH|nr:hypothetical protein [Methylocystis heyeri]QGM46104.1 hypothetical protein H2LOC_010595 [Methylocystis heyeri]
MASDDPNAAFDATMGILTTIQDVLRDRLHAEKDREAKQATKKGLAAVEDIVDAMTQLQGGNHGE